MTMYVLVVGGVNHFNVGHTKVLPWAARLAEVQLFGRLDNSRALDGQWRRAFSARWLFDAVCKLGRSFEPVVVDFVVDGLEDEEVLVGNS